jgi:hypothetical protein
LDRNELIEKARGLLTALWRAAVIALWAAREIVRTAWGIIRGPLITSLNVIAALIILFEEWGWRPLSELLARLARFAPIAALERLIASLPPYLALLAIALPTTLLLPLKFLAVWLLANGHFTTATLVFVAAKIASTALIARLFILTKPALMQLAWFARAYHWFVPWQEALFAEIRSSWVWRYGRVLKDRVKLEASRAWERLRPRIAEQWRRWTGHELRIYGLPRVDKRRPAGESQATLGEGGVRHE